MDGVGESCPPLEQVVAAIHTMSGGGGQQPVPDPRQQEQAAKWLQELQKSVHAWKISDTLLHQRLDFQTCYIAAQTLRTKVAYSFHELPSEALESLKASLVEHVSQIDETTNAVIVTQLCLALADLLLQVPEWDNVVPDLFERYAVTRPYALLEVLAVLPEEAHSRSLNLGLNRRRKQLDNMKKCVPQVLEFLSMVMLKECPENVHQGNGRVRQYKMSVLKCLKSWFTVDTEPPPSAHLYPVTILPFKLLSDLNECPAVHELAADTACNICETFDAISETSHVELQTNVYQAVKSLASEIYPATVANEDIVKALSLARVFTVYCESNYHKMLSRCLDGAAHMSMELLETLVKCCQHPDYEVAEVTFNLWFQLSEALYHENNEAKSAVFRPYIAGLVDALRHHCQIEPDYQGVPLEREEFSEFRARVSELLKDVVFIIGSLTVFKANLVYVHEYHPLHWEATESALFAMTAIGQNIVPSDVEVIPSVLSFVLNMKKSAPNGANVVNATTAGATDTVHVALRHTGVLLIGEIGEWLDDHPEHLENVLNWLMTCLQEAALASVAASSLQNICSRCQKHMIPHFPGLVQILQSLDTFNLTPCAATGLVKGVSVILSDMPGDVIKQNMPGLCGLWTQPLQHIIQQSIDGHKVEKNSKTDPVIYLDRLSSVFRYVTPDVPAGAPHPCLPAVIDHCWPVLSSAIDTWKADSRVIERTCRSIRFTLRCVGERATAMLEPLVHQMVRIYKSHPHSCFLYLGSILVDEFAHIEGCMAGLLSMLEAFLPTTFGLLQVEAGLKNNPDTVDDFFRLGVRFLQRCGVHFLQTSYIQSILDCALLSATLDHREANASTLKFIFDILHAGRSKEDRPDFETRKAIITQIKDYYGPRLVDTLIKGAVTNLPSYTFWDIGDIIYELMLYDRTVVCKWLEETLKALPQVQSTASSSVPKVTKKQLVHFHKMVTSAENPKTVCEELREFAILFR